MALIDDNYALIYQPSRRISTIYPHVVVEEVHQDALGITKHPVEIGATVTDHSFKLPARLDMFCGWSDSTAGAAGHVVEVYEALRALQATREPFEVQTGKRAYRNLLFSALALQTDQKTEHALMVRASFEEIILTRTRSAGSPGIGPKGAQADPASTGGVNERGMVTALEVGDAGYGGYDASLGLGPTTNSAGFDEMYFDGVPFSDGRADRSSTLNPSALAGNVGQFGRYGPSAFIETRPFRT